MKTLKFKFDLDSKVSIYVPSTKNVDEAFDSSEYKNKVITKLAQLFGGATASEAVGGWVCGNGSTVLEKVTIVYSFCKSEELTMHFNDIYNICMWLKEELKQEAVTLEINGQVKFV
jgi:hypothetical protein